MPEQQDPSIQLNSTETTLQGRALRALSRSPHPYHRQRAELPHALLKPSSTFPASTSPFRSSRDTDDEASGEGQIINLRGGRSARSTESDSGTEADDEHFLKGLPAPRWRPHKGLRGKDGSLSGTPSPLLSPAVLSEEGGKGKEYQKRVAAFAKHVYEDDLRKAAEKFRRKRRDELYRRFAEVALLAVVGGIVMSSDVVSSEVRRWKRETLCLILVIASLVTLYPLRLVIYLASGRSSKWWLSITIPASFDPAPLLYPPTLTMFVALLLSASNHTVLPNLILSISSLPSELIPSMDKFKGHSTLHWFVSCIPLFVSEISQAPKLPAPLSTSQPALSLDREVLALLFPLHHSLCVTLHYLTTTSLLRAELQLLSITLINLLLLSTSPQAVILKALLWGGGIGMLITCTYVLKWVVDLARVPRWRFRRPERSGKNSRPSGPKTGDMVPLLKRLKGLLSIGRREMTDESDDDDVPSIKVSCRPSELRIDLRSLKNLETKHGHGPGSISAVERMPDDKLPVTNATSPPDFVFSSNRQRRHTLPNVSPTVIWPRNTPSGRKKRSASSSLQSFFLLTEGQAMVRKWLYAGYVYACVLFIILIGIRLYIGKYALGGREPVGWALGYLFGDLPWFRMEVISANLERWICLPDRNPVENMESCRSGWVEHLRHTKFGPANTRLILCAYWLSIIIVGFVIVFRLSAIYEVDTRRKVFHFMMVAMLLPATYVDPAFAALALSLVLAIFLLLDLFRVSQLPPLSRPLASFLAPYVDGRDLRGPVVVSHIFLLIGSAIPLWLSLGTLPRSGTGPWNGWEIPTRDVSMVSGVICVGMGDAAASLIGRRYGRHKWFWSGGKSLEGSLAFATAVGVALAIAKAWLRIGGWPSENIDDWAVTFGKIGLAAVLASLTEAVLTGGNDNVVVPVVLWLCVKGLGI